MKLVSLSTEPLKSQRREGAGCPSTEKGMHQWCCSTAVCRCTLAGTAGRGGDSESQEVSLGRLRVDSQKGASLRGTGQQAPRNSQGEMF